MLLDKLDYDEPMVGIDTVATGLGAFWGSVTKGWLFAPAQPPHAIPALLHKPHWILA